jgi:hypothetical protein
VEVRELRFTALWYSGTTPVTDHAAAGQVLLFLEDESEPLAVAARGICEDDSASFCADIPSGGLVIPAGRTLELSARILATNGRERGDATTVFFLTLPADGVAARGVSSGLSLSLHNGQAHAGGEIFIAPRESLIGPTFRNVPIYGSPQSPVLSKIISLRSVTAPAPASLQAGPLELAACEVSVTASDASSPAVLSGVIFNVTATNVMLSSRDFSLSETGTPSLSVPCTAVDSAGIPIPDPVSGSFFVSCSLADGILSSRILEGAPMTYVLRGAVSNPVVVPSTSSLLIVSLQRINKQYNTFGPSGGRLLWEDSEEPGATAMRWMEHPTGYVEFLRYIGE